MTLIIENPNAEDERTTRTPGSPWRLTVSGYVIWSSTSWGDRPVQSVKTITWLSLRSGIASIGVVRSAQYPQAPTSRKAPTTRKRLRSETSTNQLITHEPLSRRRTDSATDDFSVERTDYELGGEGRGSRRKFGDSKGDARDVLTRRGEQHDDEREDRLFRWCLRGIGSRTAGRFAHAAHRSATAERHRDGAGKYPQYGDQ